LRCGRRKRRKRRKSKEEEKDEGRGGREIVRGGEIGEIGIVMKRGLGTRAIHVDQVHVRPLCVDRRNLIQQAL